MEKRSPSKKDTPPDQVGLVRVVCDYIDGHIEEPLTLATLGQQAGMSPAHLQRIFKRITGITPRQYADARRLERLKTRLRDEKEGTVTQALYESGYGSSRGLYERAPTQMGMTPGAYQRGGKGMQLRYALAGCPLGRLLLAATERGISAVYLGDQDAELLAALRKEYPAAEIEPDEDTLGAWLHELLAHLKGQRPHLALPLDVQATAFQWRVWQELLAIPYGQTRTYGEIAEALGQPQAARAVARACATNPVSIIIPCHRVVREDGGLGGYRWGLPRKRDLLDHERRNAPATQQEEEPEDTGTETR
jgi:AraC family transcriptional regulator, regulatory protein of adaptative response / methylated-DNA-[protein]-cysteine methyltransferase